MNYHCIHGTAPVSATLNVSWTDAAGGIKASDTIVADGDWTPGGWQDCATLGRHPWLEAGDKIKVSHKATVEKLVVPELSLVPDRRADTYRGRGPAGESVFAFCPLREIGEATCERGGGDSVRVGTRGNWFWDAADLRGGDTAEAYWHNSAGDVVYVITHVPYIIVTIGHGAFRGDGIAGAIASVTLIDGTTSTLKGSARVTPDRYYADFAGKFRDADGNIARPTFGDHISSNIAADAAFTLENIEATAHVATSSVTGKCPLGATNAVVRQHYFFKSWADLGQGAVDPEDGSFDISVVAGLSATTRYVAACQLQTGDFIEIFVTPS